MHRTLVQLEESLYEQLRRLAYEKGVSLSALVRELLKKAMGIKGRKKKGKIGQFKFIGIGKSKGLPKDISEEHDQYLAEDILK